MDSLRVKSYLLLQGTCLICLYKQTICLKRRPQYPGQHNRSSINRLDFMLSKQHVDAGLQMITAHGPLIYW